MLIQFFLCIGIVAICIKVETIRSNSLSSLYSVPQSILISSWTVSVLIRPWATCAFTCRKLVHLNFRCNNWTFSSEIDFFSTWSLSSEDRLTIEFHHLVHDCLLICLKVVEISLKISFVLYKLTSTISLTNYPSLLLIPLAHTLTQI